MLARISYFRRQRYASGAEVTMCLDCCWIKRLFGESFICLLARLFLLRHLTQWNKNWLLPPEADVAYCHGVFKSRMLIPRRPMKGSAGNWFCLLELFGDDEQDFDFSDLAVF